MGPRMPCGIWRPCVRTSCCRSTRAGTPPSPCICKPCAVQDWWNATTIGDYWRLWNMPVHKWLLRHIFAPAQRALGLNKFFAMTLVFAVSAAFHELLVGWPLHMVKGWAFWGVLFQVRHAPDP